MSDKKMTVVLIILLASSLMLAIYVRTRMGLDFTTQL